MSIADKARNTAEKLAGQAKEAVGKATDDEKLEAEGRKDQTSASTKQFGEDVKDAFKR